MLERLRTAGVREYGLDELTPPGVALGRRADDEDVVLLACRRSTFEWALRESVRGRAGIELREGVTVAGLSAELSRIADGIRAEDPAGIYSYGVGVEPLRTGMVGEASESLLLLMASVCFVLLVACLNLAGLGVARASSRMREVAVRMALGASRARVLRQLVTETLVLAVFGGLLGIGLAWLGTRAIVARLGHVLPRSAEIGLDARVLVVAVLACLVSGLLAALAPALRNAGWRLAPVVIALQGRVALGDEIGQALGARLVLVLLGERPGLSAPDSLGAYLTWDPRPGRTDAERNCVSNIRPEGLAPAAAAHRIAGLMLEAARRGLTGIGLKDEGRMLPG